MNKHLLYFGGILLAAAASCRVAARDVNPALLKELIQMSDAVSDEIQQSDQIDFGARRRIMDVVDGEESLIGSAHYRVLQEEGQGEFGPMRIAVDTSPLIANYVPTNAVEQARLDIILNDVVDVIVKIWQSALNVRPREPLSFFDGSMLISGSGTCSGIAPFPGEPVDADYLVFVAGYRANEVRCGETGERGVLGFASSCALSFSDFSPRAGQISFCMERFDYDVDPELFLSVLQNVGLHEISHALGWSASRFALFNVAGAPGTSYGSEMGTFSCVSSDDVTTVDSKPIVITPKYYDPQFFHLFYELQLPRVAQISRNIFNCPTMTGARLENQPTGSGCFGSHLDERLYFDSLMSPFQGPGNEDSSVFSALTLAFMEDTGWYKPNYRNSGEVTFGAGAGCDFVERECIDRSTKTIRQSMRGFFCDFTETNMKCSPGYRSRARCLNSAEEGNTTVPPSFQYFGDEKIGGFQWTDYCPITSEYDPTRLGVENACPSDQRCFELEKADSVCLNFECDADKYQVKFKYGHKMHACKDDFETIDVKGLGEVVCPRVAVICPSIGCPAHCSGAGHCDWTNMPGPKCICFDPEDDTDGCYGDMMGNGGKGGRGKGKGKGKKKRELEVNPKAVRGH